MTAIQQETTQERLEALLAKQRKEELQDQIWEKMSELSEAISEYDRECPIDYDSELGKLWTEVDTENRTSEEVFPVEEDD